MFNMFLLSNIKYNNVCCPTLLYVVSATLFFVFCFQKQIFYCFQKHCYYIVPDMSTPKVKCCMKCPGCENSTADLVRCTCSVSCSEMIHQSCRRLLNAPVKKGIIASEEDYLCKLQIELRKRRDAEEKRKKKVNDKQEKPKDKQKIPAPMARKRKEKNASREEITDDEKETGIDEEKSNIILTNVLQDANFIADKESEKNEKKNKSIEVLKRRKS